MKKQRRDREAASTADTSDLHDAPPGRIALMNIATAGEVTSRDTHESREAPVCALGS